MIINIYLIFYIFLLLLFKCKGYIINIDEGESAEVLLSKDREFNYDYIENLVVFGDSHSQVKTNYTDMTYTFNNGGSDLKWPLHFINYKNLTFWSYSLGGTTIDQTLVMKSHFFKKDLKEMYELFYETMIKNEQNNKKWNSDNTLFTIYVGFNDINHIFYGHDAKTDIDKIANELLKVLEKIYEVGGRNFLFMNIQPMEKIRLFRDRNPQLKEDAKINSIYFNERLNIISKMFYNNHTDLNVFIFNTHEFYENVINNCYDYGFKNCVIMWRESETENDQDFFWYDEFHITNKANKHLGESLNRLFESIVEF